MRGLVIPTHISSLQLRMRIKQRVGWSHGWKARKPKASNEGNDVPSSEVQEALADILNMEVRKAQVKEEILADLEAKKQKMRLIGQEIADGFKEEIELDKMRAELASNMSLAETMEKFQELEDEVQAVRDQLQADKQELADWEEKTANARNEGLFFKRLYKTQNKTLQDDGDDSDVSLNKERARKIVSEVKAQAGSEVRSPWRLYVFVYLSAVALMVLLEDLLSGHPSYGEDVLYAAIASAMIFNVWSERRALKDLENDS